MPVIRKVIGKKRGRRPVLVDFQNGKINPNEANFMAGLYKDTEGKPIVAITTDKMLYTGVLDENQLHDNFLLVHNKENDEIHLIQVDHSTVYPEINKVINSGSFVSATSDTSLSNLNRQFGSKKTKRITEQRERLAMNIDAVKDQLDKTVSTIEIDEPNLDAHPSENDNLCRPKINRDASTRDEVYNLEDIVPINILDTLYPEASNMLSSNSTEIGLSSFVKECVSRVSTSQKADNDKIRSITIFLYIHYLMKFINTPMKNVTKKFVVCEKSTDVNQHILDNFSVISPNGRARPLHMKDKCLCYILVLTAIANEYEVNITSLSKDLKIGIKKAMEISRILAFTISTKNKGVALLNFPLPPPVTFNAKRNSR